MYNFNNYIKHVFIILKLPKVDSSEMASDPDIVKLFFSNGICNVTVKFLSLLLVPKKINIRKYKLYFHTKANYRKLLLRFCQSIITIIVHRRKQIYSASFCEG